MVGDTKPCMLVLTSKNLAVLRTTLGWPDVRASSTNVLLVGSCSRRRSSANEPQLMVMPAATHNTSQEISGAHRVCAVAPSLTMLHHLTNT